MLVSRRLFSIMTVMLFAPFAIYIIFIILKFENLGNFASMMSTYVATGILLFAYKKTNPSRNISINFLLLALACFAWAIGDTVWAIISLYDGNAQDSVVTTIIYSLTNFFCLLLDFTWE